MANDTTRAQKLINKRNSATAVILFSLLTLSIIFPLQPKLLDPQVPRSEKNDVEHTALFDSPEIFFADIRIVADSVFIWDIKNQRSLFEKNPDKIMPLASIAKMLAASLAVELAPTNTEIRMEKKFLEAEGDSGFYVDERWTLKDLLEFSLITSSNDGFRAIASVIGSISAGAYNSIEGRQKFIEMLNQKIKGLGLKDTVVYDETGLDQSPDQSGAYSTARETALFFQYLLREHPEILESTSKRELFLVSLSDKHHVATNTNLIAKKVPGIIGAKTGYTDLAGGNLATVFNPNLDQPITIVVLGSNIEDRFTDTEKLIDATRRFIIEEKKSVSQF